MERTCTAPSVASKMGEVGDVIANTKAVELIEPS